MEISSEIKPTLSSLCIGLIERARSELQEPDALENADTVHFVRVLTKQLRAAWRLGCETAGKDLVRDRRRALRELSGHLAGSRDQTVLIRLCRDLAVREKNETVRVILTRLAENIRLNPVESVIQPCRIATPAEILAELSREKSAWESLDWSNRQKTRRGLRRQIRKSDRRVVSVAARASKDSFPEIWHEWRKAVKQLRYQREFLAELQGRHPGNHDRCLARLGKRLGERNDLANLSHYAESLDNLSGPEHGWIRQAIERAEEIICRNCRRLGRRLH